MERKKKLEEYAVCLKGEGWDIVSDGVFLF